MSEVEDAQPGDPPIIIKVGGGESINVEGIIRDLAAEPQPIIVVLGANAARDRLAEKLDMPTQMIQSVSGYDSVYTDQNAIDLIMMTYAGAVRNRFVECCQRHGINAVGLSGLDGRLIQGERNRGIRVRENGKTLIKRDYSGKPRQINGSLLRFLLGQGYTPVFEYSDCRCGRLRDQRRQRQYHFCIASRVGRRSNLPVHRSPGAVSGPRPTFQFDTQTFGVRCSNARG